MLSSLTGPELLGVASGAIQLCAYAIYIRAMRRRRIDANPIAWLIFSFDTLVFTGLEAFAGAPAPLLVLPFACAGGAVWVAALLAKGGRMERPQGLDAWMLAISVVIAVGYCSLFAMQMAGGGGNAIWYWTVLFLLLSNLNTFVAFVPLVRDVALFSRTEQPLPWVVWTLAYSLLGVATVLEMGHSSDLWLFMIYPVSCALLHGLVAVISCRRQPTCVVRAMPDIGKLFSDDVDLSVSVPHDPGQSLKQ